MPFTAFRRRQPRQQQRTRSPRPLYIAHTTATSVDSEALRDQPCGPHQWTTQRDASGHLRGCQLDARTATRRRAERRRRCWLQDGLPGGAGLRTDEPSRSSVVIGVLFFLTPQFSISGRCARGTCSEQKVFPQLSGTKPPREAGPAEGASCGVVRADALRSAALVQVGGERKRHSDALFAGVGWPG